MKKIPFQRPHSHSLLHSFDSNAMKAQILLISSLVLVFSFSTKGQIPDDMLPKEVEPINLTVTTDSMGRVLQAFTDYWDRAQKLPRRTGTLLDGHEHGEWTYWYEDGTMKEKSNYWEGMFHGSVELWYENGKKESEGFFRYGRPDSTYADWWENGQQKSKGAFNSGIKWGKWDTWYESGSKKREQTFGNGTRTVQNSWNPDGTQTLSSGNGLLVEWLSLIHI